MHTAKHLLNAIMIKLFGCLRSRNVHIERRKSKRDYQLATCLTEAQIQHIEKTSDIETFKISSYDYDKERKILRLRFKLIEKK